MRSEERTSPISSVGRAVALVVVVALPLDLRIGTLPVAGRQANIFLFELPLALLMLLTLSHLISRWRIEHGLISPLVPVLFGLLVLSALVHPSFVAWLRVGRYLGAGSIAYWIWSMGEIKRAKTRLFVATGAIGFLLAEFAIVEYFFRSNTSAGFPYAQATFASHHVFAGFCIVLIGLLVTAYWRGSRDQRWGWAATVGIVASALGVTFSRQALVAWLLIVLGILVAAIRRHQLLVPLLVAVVLGPLTTGVIANEHWMARAEETIEGDGPGGDDEGADVGGRWRLAKEATIVTYQHPLTGTGMGGYLPSARRDLDIESGDVLLVPHNVILFAAAENGVVVGALLLILIAVTGWKSFRAGALPLLLFLSFTPFLMLDHFPYDESQGIAVMGCWIGSMLVARGEIRSSQEKQV